MNLLDAFAPRLRLRESTLALQCSACPTAWDVQTEGGRAAYIRYRYGSLSVNLATTDGFWRVWEKQVGEDLDGVMSEAEMREHLAGIVVFIP